MKIQIKKEDQELQDQSSESDSHQDDASSQDDISAQSESSPQDQKDSRSDPIQKLSLENAELKGRLSALESIQKSSPGAPQTIDQQEAWKNQALQDINILDDEEFQTKYKHQKFQVNSAILQYDFNKQTVEQKRQLAELRAENSLMSKYQDFSEYRSAVQDAVDDSSIEVRQDPARLQKVMERAYLAASRENPVSPKRKEDSMERRMIQSQFEKPRPKNDGIPSKVETDKIPPEFSPICKAFGLTSEKERQELMKSDDVETHYGDGIVFRDREKGFEKVA